MDQPGSSEVVFRPMRRLLEPTPSGDDLSGGQGKRSIRPGVSMEVARAEMRHNMPQSRRSGFDEPERGVPWDSKAQVSWPEKANNARDFIATERILEVECGIKVKVGPMSRMRNGIPVRNPGDKVRLTSRPTIFFFLLCAKSAFEPFITQPPAPPSFVASGRILHMLITALGIFMAKASFPVRAFKHAVSQNPWPRFKPQLLIFPRA